MEQFSDDELDHAAEEDSDKEDQDLDQMFGAWLGELDKLTKVCVDISVFMGQCLNWEYNVSYCL